MGRDGLITIVSVGVLLFTLATVVVIVLSL
jgi:hypothetical protein